MFVNDMETSLFLGWVPEESLYHGYRELPNRQVVASDDNVSLVVDLTQSGYGWEPALYLVIPAGVGYEREATGFNRTLTRVGAHSVIGKHVKQPAQGSRTYFELTESSFKEAASKILS